MSYLLLLFCLIFLFSGLYFYCNNNHNVKEGFVSTKQRCPNLLIQKGASFYLYNTNLAEIPGVNPIEFYNLEEYTEFLKWQRSVGITCPVLYLQHTYDTQGNGVYKVRPSVTELQAGLPPAPVIKQKITLLTDASRNDYPYNSNSYPGFDSQNQDIGKRTPLDVENDYELNTLLSSDSAMSPYWNSDLANQHITQGYYKNDEVSIYIP
jgi:hypothetical protein